MKVIDYSIPIALKKKGDIFFDEYYKKLGLEIIRQEGIANKDYDVFVHWNNNGWKIEEKTASYWAPYMPFEEHQDYPKNDGWIFYTKADFIMYLYFKNEQPYICYLIYWKKAMEFYMDGDYEKKIYTNTKYKGDTRGILIPWKRLIYEDIVSVVFKQE